MSQSTHNADSFGGTFRNLVEYTPVESMVTAFELAREEIRQGYDLLQQAEGRLNTAFTAAGGSARFDANPRDCDGVGPKQAQRVINRLHRTALRCIIDRLGIWPLLGEKRTAQLNTQLESGTLEELPEISAASLHTMVESIAGDLSKYFAEAVSEVYEWLRPHPHWRKPLKTNSEWQVGKKVIVYAMDLPWRSGGRHLYSPSHRGQTNLCAMDNVFHYLDGVKRKPGSCYGDLVDVIRANEDTGVGVSTYFAFKACRNGNIHITFLRPDLVRQFNAIAGGNRLKPGEADEDPSLRQVAGV